MAPHAALQEAAKLQLKGIEDSQEVLEQLYGSPTVIQVQNFLRLMRQEETTLDQLREAEEQLTPQAHKLMKALDEWRQKKVTQAKQSAAQEKQQKGKLTAEMAPLEKKERQLSDEHVKTQQDMERHKYRIATLKQEIATTKQDIVKRKRQIAGCERQMKEDGTKAAYYLSEVAKLKAEVKLYQGKHDQLVNALASNSMAQPQNANLSTSSDDVGPSSSPQGPYTPQANGTASQVKPKGPMPLKKAADPNEKPPKQKTKEPCRDNPSPTRVEGRFF